MLKAILSALDKGGVKHKTEKRGLDHGVWGTLYEMARTENSPFLGRFRGKDGVPSDSDIFTW
jgi:aromatic ring-opening dioxygenase catalytic subunit (LigB family)